MLLGAETGRCIFNFTVDFICFYRLLVFSVGLVQGFPHSGSGGSAEPLGGRQKPLEPPRFWEFSSKMSCMAHRRSRLEILVEISQRHLPFTDSHSCVVSLVALMNLRSLYSVAPVLPGGWVLVGEQIKYVPVSPQRIVAGAAPGPVSIATTATAPGNVGQDDDGLDPVELVSNDGSLSYVVIGPAGTSANITVILPAAATAPATQIGPDQPLASTITATSNVPAAAAATSSPPSPQPQPQPRVSGTQLVSLALGGKVVVTKVGLLGPDGCRRVTCGGPSCAGKCCVAPGC
jgi:hypothetical protein